VTVNVRAPLRLLSGLAAIAILAIGLYGTFSYVDAYNKYRGFAPPKDPKGVPPGHVEQVGFYSEALHRQRSYLVYEPPGYQQLVAGGGRLPVLYLLHGAPGLPISLLQIGDTGVQLDILLHQHLVRPMLLVIPDGSSGGFYSDTEWADSAKGRYETLILDVIHDVDRRFPTLPSRLDRAVAGYSQGGYASVNFAFHHLGEVSIAESWSGYFTQTNNGVFSDAASPQLAYNSPAVYLDEIAPRLHHTPLSVFIYSGEVDPGTPVVQAFAARLAGAGANVIAAAYPGAHDWRLWRNHIDDSLRFASRYFGVTKRGPSILHLASEQQLAAARAQYAAARARAQLAYCRRHGVASRAYCPVVLGLVPTPNSNEPAMLTLTLAAPDVTALQPGGTLHGTLASDRAGAFILTATLPAARRHNRGFRHGRERRRIVVASGSANFATAGVTPLDLILTPQGRRTLRARRGTNLVISATGARPDGSPLALELTVFIGR